MSIPTSLIVVLLVAAWLAVLVPMVAKRREHVPEAEEGGQHFRVLRRASASLRRRPKFANTSEDDIDVDELDEAVADDDLEEVLLDNEHDIERPDEELDEPEISAPARRTTVLVKESRTVRAEVRQSVRDEADDVEETYELDDDQDLEEVAISRSGRDDDHLDDPRYRPIPKRQGRGGYDPEAAEATRAYRYSRRRKITLFLLLATLAFGAAAYFLMPLLWAGTGVFGVLLVAYLGYLRRQVRIEEDIRLRRMARLRRARQIRPEYGRAHEEEEAYSPYEAAPPAPEPVREPYRAESSVPPSPQLGRGRRRMVELDDDDPAFDELEYYQPVTYRRAAGQ